MVTNRFGSEEERLVLKALRSQELSPYFRDPDGGPMVQQLEHDFAEYVGTDYAVAVSNGTTALLTAYCALGLRPWQKVVVPAHTFIATASMVLAAQAWPVFADVDNWSYCMLPVHFEQIIKHYRTDVRAVAPVDLLGYPCDIEEIYDYARRKRIFVVEDAAQALGSERRKGRKVGSEFNDCATWSGQFTKSWSTGEGGMITTNDRSFVRRCKAIRSHGSYYSDADYLTYNFRMTELEAAVGIAQLRKLPRILAQQRRNAKCVLDRMPKSIVKPHVAGGGVLPNWYIIGCKVDPLKFDKKAFLGLMRARGVSIGRPGRVVSEGYTKPLYEKPIFSWCKPQAGQDWKRCPTAERLSKSWVWFDIHRFRPLTDVKKDMKIINEVVTT